MPSPCWTATAVAGNVLSGVEVASTIRSIACASSPAFSSAARAAIAIEHVVDLGQEIVMDHLIANLDGGGKALGIGAAMALDHDAVQAQQHAAVGLAGIELVPQLPEGAAGQQIADARKQALFDGIAQEGHDLPGRAF